MAYSIDNEYYRKQINQDGVVPLERNNRDRWNSATQYIQAGQDYLNIPSYRTQNPGFIQDSQYDKLVGNISLLTPEDYYNSLQQQQNTWAALGNALVNNVVIAGTTFAQNMIGIPSGVFNAINDNNFSSQFINPLSKTLVDWQKQVQEQLPIYRGSDYENKNLWEKMGNGVFWADLLQNFGFTEGSAAAMAVCKALGMPMMLSAFAGSIGEATVQAVNKYNENIKYKQDLLDQQLVNDMAKATSEQERQRLIDNRLHNDALIDDDERRAGNVNYIENIGLLTLTNAIEFGQWLQQDYSLARIALKGRANPIVENGFVTGIEKLSKGEEMLRAVGMKTLQASSEGFEELAQDIFDKQTLFRNSEKFNNVLFDDEYRDKATNMLDTFVQGLTSTLNDKQTAVDVMSGFITGFIGTPTLSKHVFENGIISGIRNTNRAVENTNAIIDEINRRLEKDPISKSTYDNLIRQLMIQDEQNIALEKNDEKGFKDATSASYISDLINYDDIGLLYLKEQELESYRNMSDEQLQELIKPINDPKTGEPFSLEEARENLNKRIDFMERHLDSFKKNKKAFLSRYPNVSNETLHQALFLTSQVDSWRGRMNESGDIAYNQYVKLWDRLVQTEKDEVINDVTYKHNGRYRRKKVNDQRILKPYNKERILRDNEVVVQQQQDKTYTIIDNPQELSDNTTAYIAKKSDLKRVFDTKEEEGFFNKMRKMLNISNNTPDTDVRYSLETTPLTKNEFLRLLTVFPDFGNTQIEIMNDQRYGFTEDEKRIFETSVQEYPQLVQSINKYINDYQDMISNINKYDIEQKEKPQKVRKAKKNRQKQSFKDTLKNISTVKEFEKELRNSNLSEEEKQQIVDELIGDKHLAANEYKLMKQYFDTIVKDVQETETEPEDETGTERRLTEQAKSDVLSLLKDNYEYSSNFNEFSNPESQRINYTQLFPNTPQGAIRKDRAQFYLKLAMNDINENDSRFSGLVSPSSKDEGVKQPVKQTVSSSIVLNGQEIKSEVFTKPESKEVVFDDTSKEYEEVQKTSVIEEKQDSQNEYMRPALPQFVWYSTGKNQGSILVTFDDYKRRTNGGDYSEIVQYLTAAGAYDYINKGKLKAGDEIEFIVDPKIKYQGQPQIILRSKGQIIGSLNIGNASQYRGLQKLISNIYEAYNKIENKDEEYIYLKDGKPFVTRVSQIMNGNIMIARDEDGNNIENNIYDILDKDDQGKILNMPIIGVMTQNGIETNGKIASGKIIQPNSLLLQYGRVFILSPNATGEYVAIPLYTKRLSESEFNLKDKDTSNTIVGQQIKRTIRQLYDNSSESWDDFERAIHNLANILYLGDVHINTYAEINGEYKQVDRDTKFEDGFNIDQLRIFRFKTNPNGTYETDESGKRIEENMSVVKLDDGSGVDVVDNLIDAFMKLNVPIQVNANTINSIAGEYDYNQGLISSGVLTSNISSIDIQNAWFTMDYFDESSGVFVEAKNPKAKTKPKMMSEYSSIDGGNIVRGKSLDNLFPVNVKGLNGGLYHFDPQEKKVYKDGNDVTSKLSDDFINKIKYMYIVKNNMTQIHSYNNIYIINFGTDNEIYFNYDSQTVVTNDNTKQEVKNHVLENLKSKKKYSDFIQQVGNYKKLIVSNEADTPKTHRISNEDQSEIKEYIDVSDVYNPNNMDRIPEDIYNILIGGEKNFKKQFYAVLRDDSLSNEQKINSINSKINKILDNYFIYSTRLSNLFPVTSQERRRLYLNNISEFTEEWIDWFFSESPLIQQIKAVPRIYNDRYLIEQSFKEFVSDIFGGKLSEYMQQTGAYIEKNKDITSEQKQVREELAQRYRMQPENFVVLLRRMNNFIKDQEQQGCKIIATNLKVFNTYGDQNIAGNIDMLLSDDNGNVYIYDFFATRKFWDTKNPMQPDSKTQQLYSDATIESDKLILLKNMFETQYGIKVHEVVAIPITYGSNSKGILNETPLVKRYLNEDDKYEQSLNYLEISSYANTAEEFYTFDKDSKKRVVREGTKLDAYTLDNNNVATWRQHSKIQIPDTTSSVIDGIAYNVEYSTKQAEQPVVTEKPVEEKPVKESPAKVENKQKLTDDQKKVMSVFDKNDSLTRTGVQKQLGWTFKKTSDIINELVQTGQLVESGKQNGKPKYSSVNRLTPTEVEPLVQPEVSQIIEKRQSNPSDSQSQTTDNNDDDDLFKEAFGDDFDSNRVADYTKSFRQMNFEKELQWLRKVLPQVNQDAAIRIFDKIIDSGNQELWGHFTDGLILLETGAAEGTVYHEAFHLVFQTIFNDSERNSIINDAVYQFGLKMPQNAKERHYIEEQLAEAFMEYTLYRNDKGLVERIKQFFRYMIDVIRVGLKMQPHVQYYFYKINSGKYANNQPIVVNEQRTSFNNITTINNIDEFRKIPPAQRRQMIEKGWTQQSFDSLSDEEKQQVVHCIHV